MPHRCGRDCDRLKRLLREGSKNGVWENVFRHHDVRLVEVAEECPDVDVRHIGNKKLLVLRDPDATDVSPRPACPSPPVTPTSKKVTAERPRSSLSNRKQSFLPYRRVEVSWVDSANLFYVHDVEAEPNYLPQIEETLRYLKGRAGMQA